MRDLHCDAVVGERRDETDDGLRKAQGHYDQVRVAYRLQVHEPVDAPVDRLDDAPVPERIEHVECDSVADGLAHAKLAAVFTEDLFRSLLHVQFQTACLHLIIRW